MQEAALLLDLRMCTLNHVLFHMKEVPYTISSGSGEWSVGIKGVLVLIALRQNFKGVWYIRKAHKSCAFFFPFMFSKNAVQSSATPSTKSFNSSYLNLGKKSVRGEKGFWVLFSNGF